MYKVDGSGIERLKAIFALMAKLSGVVVVFDTAAGLEFIAENTSQTVQTRAFVARGSDSPRPSRAGLPQKYTLKATTLDKVFSTVSPVSLDKCTIELGEQLTLHCVYNNLKRTHKIDLLEPVDLGHGPQMLKGAHAFVLRVDMLKIILSHFSASAEMVELWLDEAGGVRWRGYRNPQRATREEMYSKIDSTAAMHYTEMLQGLRVEVPWRAEFKLKELRYTAQFFEKVCKDGEFCCIFDDPGSPINFCAGGGGFSYCIQFATGFRPTSSEIARQTIKWQLAPTEFTLAPDVEDPESDEDEPSALPVRLAAKTPVEPLQFADHSPLEATAETSMQDSHGWEALNPHAEIPATQQERTRGLFD